MLFTKCLPALNSKLAILPLNLSCTHRSSPMTFSHRDKYTPLSYYEHLLDFLLRNPSLIGVKKIENTVFNRLLTYSIENYRLSINSPIIELFRQQTQQPNFGKTTLISGASGSGISVSINERLFNYRKKYDNHLICSINFDWSYFERNIANSPYADTATIIKINPLATDVGLPNIFDLPVGQAIPSVLHANQIALTLNKIEGLKDINLSMLAINIIEFYTDFYKNLVAIPAERLMLNDELTALFKKNFDMPNSLELTYYEIMNVLDAKLSGKIQSGSLQEFQRKLHYWFQPRLGEFIEYLAQKNVINDAEFTLVKLFMQNYPAFNSRTDLKVYNKRILVINNDLQISDIPQQDRTALAGMTCLLGYNFISNHLYKQTITSKPISCLNSVIAIDYLHKVNQELLQFMIDLNELQDLHVNDKLLPNDLILTAEYINNLSFLDKINEFMIGRACHKNEAYFIDSLIKNSNCLPNQLENTSKSTYLALENGEFLILLKGKIIDVVCKIMDSYTMYDSPEKIFTDTTDCSPLWISPLKDAEHYNNKIRVDIKNIRLEKQLVANINTNLSNRNLLVKNIIDYKNLKDCSFENCIVSLIFDFCHFHNVSFKNSTLSYCEFMQDYVSLSDVKDIPDGDSSMDFTNAVITHSCFSGVNMANVRCENTLFIDCTFYNMDMENINAVFKNCRFIDCHVNKLNQLTNKTVNDFSQNILTSEMLDNINSEDLKQVWLSGINPSLKSSLNRQHLIEFIDIFINSMMILKRADKDYMSFIYILKSLNIDFFGDFLFALKDNATVYKPNQVWPETAEYQFFSVTGRSCYFDLWRIMVKHGVNISDEDMRKITLDEFNQLDKHNFNEFILKPVEQAFRKVYCFY